MKEQTYFERCKEVYKKGENTGCRGWCEAVQDSPKTDLKEERTQSQT